MFCVLAVLFFNPIVEASTTSDCSSCHGTTVDSFITPTVPKADVCKVCHEAINDSHSGGSVYVSGYGYFKSADNINATPADIHKYHSGFSYINDGTSCSKCHGQVDCNSCHTNITHGKKGDLTDKHNLLLYPEYQTIKSYKFADRWTYTDKQLNCTTSQCHSYYTPFPGVVKTRSDGTQLCLNCHSTDRSGHGDIGVKHTANPLTNQDIPLAGDCAVCHDATFDTAHTKTIEANGTSCSLCHGTTADPVAVEGISKVRNGEARTCDLCHDNSSRHNSYPVSHEDNFPADANMDCSACHSSDLRAEHMVAGSSDPNTSCKRCHEYNGTRASVDKSVVMNAITNNETKCTACHSIHASVETIHDFSAKFVPDNTTPGCTSCHSGSLDVEHSFNKLTNTARVIKDGDFADQTIAGTDDSCKICHNSLTTARSTEVKTVVQAEGDKYCTSCHVVHNDDQIHTVAEPFVVGETLNCAECHQGTLQTEHADWGVGCNKCHGDTNLQTGFDPAVVANAVATGAKNCDACHDSTRLPKPVHSTANHNGVFPVQFINCNTCHTNVLDVEHAKWSAPGSVQKYDCKVCHNSDKVEVKNAISTGNRECIACHASDTIHPSTQYTPKHNGNFPRPANLASYDACNTCHYDNLLTDHSRTPDVGKEVYCTDCHNSTNTQVQTAIASLNTNCAGCHAEATIHSADVDRHKTTFMATPPFSCNNCHQEAATRGLIEEHLTRKDASGNSFTCATCHKSADAKVKTAISTKATNCDACHTIHGDITTVHTINNSIEGKGWPTEPAINCAMCHNAQVTTEHTSRPDKNVPDGSVNYTCDTCHASTRQDVKDAIAQDTISCSACHGPAHASVETQHQGDFIVKDGYNCADCHSAVTGASTKGQLIPIHEALGCQVCHSSTVSDTVKTAVTTGNANCSACHGDATTVHANDAELHSGVAFDTTKVDCNKCHNQSLFVEHFETASRTDDAGNAITCNTCHQSTNKQVTDAITAGDTSCKACHAIHLDDEATKHTQGNFPTVASAPVNCANCHNANAAQEHGITRKQTSAGVAMNCNTCHTSTRTDVTTAISTDNAKCNACHSSIHAASAIATKHQSGFATNAAGCSDCHNNQLEIIHTGNTKAGVAMNCNTCHESQLSNVKQAISSKNRNCDACHTVHSNITEAHTVPIDAMVPNPQIACKDCHKNYLPDEHLKAVSTAPTENTNIAYEVFRSTSATTGFTMVGNVVGTSYSDGTLSPSTTYYYKVRAYDVAGNRSGDSNIASAITPATPPASQKMNPTSAYYCEGNGDSSSDNNKSNALSALTNNRDSTSSSDSYQIREDGSSNDRYVWVRLDNTDARDYKAVKLELRFRWYNKDSSGNILVYPYKSDGTNINTSTVVDYKMSNLSTNWVTHTIDVTNAAKTMNNFGWMKFRIKPGTAGGEERAYLSEVRIILENDQTSATGVTTTSSSIAQEQNGDSTPPTAPTNLVAIAKNSVQIDLNWTASTDVGPTTINNGTCTLCHNSTARQQVKDAVADGKITCDSCHTIHSDVNTQHTVSVFPNDLNVNCAQCHTKVVTTEHLTRKNTTGTLYTCSTCHSSTRTDVKTAITNNNLDCRQCHGATHTGYKTEHKTTNTNCTRCHGGLAQIEKHRNGCNTCHSSTVSSTVKNAVLAQNTDCTTCHGDKHGSWGR